MAKSNKLTIRITPARRTETITWQGSGVFGTLNLSTYSGELMNQPLTSGASAEAYFKAVVTAVLAAMP